jgi:hypothetical protein
MINALFLHMCYKVAPIELNHTNLYDFTKEKLQYYVAITSMSPYSTFKHMHRLQMIILDTLSRSIKHCNITPKRKFSTPKPSLHVLN